MGVCYLVYILNSMNCIYMTKEITCRLHRHAHLMILAMRSAMAACPHKRFHMVDTQENLKEEKFYRIIKNQVRAEEILTIYL